MPVIISSELVLNAELAIPLSHPRILYDDVWREGNITASSTQTGFSPQNVADGLTWDFWQPTDLPATIEVQCDQDEEVDYALIAAHDLGSNEVTVKAQYHNGSVWVDLVDYNPADDKVIAFLFDPVVASRFRLSLDGENSPQQLPSIGILMMGKALAMPRGMSLKNKPVTMSRRTVARPQLSEGGQLLGRSIWRQGVRSALVFEHLDAEWYRANFDPFAESARVYPFGWVWHPEKYPMEVAFLWTPSGKEDIGPEYSGLPNRLNVSFDVEGIVE